MAAVGPRTQQSSVTLDLDSVAFIDSIGLRTLIVAAQSSRRDGDRLRIRCGSSSVRRVIDLTSVQPLLPLVARFDHCLAGKKGSGLMIDFSFELDPRLSAGQRTREIVRERVGERLSDGHIYALLTVVTELVNNAVQYESGRRIDVRITLADDLSVRGMVDDHGNGPRLRLREAPAPPSQSGLGMRMMDVHADRWGVSQGSTGVWFEIGEDSRSRAPDGNFSGAERTEEPKPNRSPNDGSTDSGGGPRSRTLRRRRAGNGAGSSS